MAPKHLFLWQRLKNNSLLPILSLLLIVCAVYWPGLNGPYVFDDGENILLNSSVALSDLTRENLFTALMSNDSGPLKRPVAAISFALNHYFNGGFYPTFAFKATNLAIHLLNACLIYLLSLRLLESPRLMALLDKNSRRSVAVFTAALWALHPIHLTNILYVVQRMNSLSALFVLAGLILFIQGRSIVDTDLKKGLTLMAGGILGGMGLGLAAKENAVLMLLFALVLEYVLYGFKTRKIQNQNHLLWFYILLVALPALSLAAYLLFIPDLIVDSYLTRHFSLLERVLTETRVLWLYVWLLLFPISPHFGLFHDDIALSTGLFTPVTTGVAAIGLLAVLGAGVSLAKRYPVFSFAVLWFLAGHVLESGILGLELAHEHRNYLPSYGILFAVTFGLASAVRKKRAILLLVLSTVILTFSFVTWTRASIWSDIHSLAEHTVRSHPDSPRANDFAARTSLGVRHDTTAAIRYTLSGLKLAPQEVGFHLDLQILLNSVAAEIEASGQNPKNWGARRRFEVQITGLNETMQAVVTKDGILLSRDDSNPETISALLRTKPISVHGIFSLENLRHCILDPPESCARLNNIALSWFDIAAENPRASRHYRAIILSNAAMLRADADDISRALEYINQAAALLPERVSYQIAKAEYLIRLGRLDEAGQIINLISAGPTPKDTPGKLHYENLFKLKTLHEKASNEKRHAPLLQKR